MNTRSTEALFLGSKARPALAAYNLAAICEPIVQTMWDREHLTSLQASMACYGDNFTFFSLFTDEALTMLIFHDVKRPSETSCMCLAFPASSLKAGRDIRFVVVKRGMPV
jgi:hypothetical protein